MKKIKLVLLLMCVLGITATKDSYGLSIQKPGDNAGWYDLLNYVKVSDFVKLSSKQFSELTGKKMTMAEKLSFLILKSRMKHVLKKDPDIKIKDYFSKKKSSTLSVLLWILIGFFALILLAVLIFGKLN